MMHIRIGWAILMALNSCLGHSSAENTEQSGGNSESVRMGSTAGSHTLNAQSPAIRGQIALQKQMHGSVSHFYLRLSGASVKVAPEGIYELYILNHDVSALTKLKSEDSGFAETLNTYALSPDQKLDLNVDVTMVLRRLFPRALPGALHFAILFRGNIDSNGTESRNAGEFSFEGASILAAR